ncbi:MAG: hypothetical protein RR280_04335 [Bacteroidaceae bacterium]
MNRDQAIGWGTTIRHTIGLQHHVLLGQYFTTTSYLDLVEVGVIIYVIVVGYAFPVSIEIQAKPKISLYHVTHRWAGSVWYLRLPKRVRGLGSQFTQITGHRRSPKVPLRYGT